MNAERLHAIALAIQRVLQQTEMVSILERLGNALSTQVDNPAEPSAQQQAGQLRQEFADRTGSSESRDFSPVWMQEIKDLGIEDLLPPVIDARVEEIFQRNEITPVIARDEIRTLLARVVEMQNALNQLVPSLQWLKVPAEHLEPGEFEIGILLPRSEVDSALGELGGEFAELERILLPFAELTTGSRPQFEVRSISSSDFSVFLHAVPEVAACVAVAMERITTFYLQVLNIRSIRKQLEDADMPENMLSEADEQADSRMGQGIDIIVNELVQLFPDDSRAERENELRTELKKSLRALAYRVDHGYNIAVDAGEDEPATAADAETPEVETRRRYRQIVAERRKAMQFLTLEGKPILSLGDGGGAKL